MKIAVLILAHKNKEQLERLLSALQHHNIDIFVHLDRKSSIQSSDIHVPNVFFTKKRHDVGLFEFSMVDAEMELIQTARSHGHYDYYILMSGQCYPIKRIDNIYDYLCKKYPEPFIEIVAPTEHNYVRKNFAHVYVMKRFKLKTYAFLKKHFSYKAYRVLRYVPGGFVFAVSLIKELFVRSPKTRLDRINYPTYCGSQWWILPDRIIDRTIEFYQNKHFCKIVYDTFSCDETFFQTAIMAEKERNGIVVDDQGNYMNRRWFYIFGEGHPFTLTQKDYDQIISSEMLFARKFDTDIDARILDSLDAVQEV